MQNYSRYFGSRWTPGFLFPVGCFFLLSGLSLPVFSQTSDSALVSAIVSGKSASTTQAAAIEKLSLDSAKKLNARVVYFQQPAFKARTLLLKIPKTLTAQQIKLSDQAALEHLSGLVKGNPVVLRQTLGILSNYTNTYTGVARNNRPFGNRPVTLNFPVTLNPSLICAMSGAASQFGAPATSYAPAVPNESLPVIASGGDGAISTPMSITGNVSTQPGWFGFMNGTYNYPNSSPSLQAPMSQIGITLTGGCIVPSTTGIVQTVCLFKDSGKLNETIQGTEVLYGGNHGHYEMKLQVLKMNAQGIPQFNAQGQPDFEDAGPVGTLDLYGPGSNQPGAAGVSQMVIGMLSASATFGQIANVARVAVRCYLGDTRVGSQSYDVGAGFVNNNGGHATPGYQDTFPEAYYSPTSSNAFAPAWNYEAPFEVDVVPTEMFQVKYMPLAIVYAPPGDGSSANYKISNTYTSKFTLQDAWANKYTNSNLTVSTFALNLGANFPVYNVSGGYNTEWDVNTTAVTNTTNTVQNAWSMSSSNSIQVGAQMGGLPPNDSEPFNAQPFWADQYILIPHAQFAVWNYQPSNGGDGPALNIMQLVGIPIAEYPASVGQLADCALSGFCSSQCSLNTILTGAGYDALSPYEASCLLSLDPFYTAQWQGWPGLTGSSTPVANTDTGGRGALVVKTAFGAEPSSSGNANAGSKDLTVIQDSITQTTDTTLTKQIAYASSVETDFKQTTTMGGGANFSPVSMVSGSLGLSSSSSSTAKTITELDFTPQTSNETTVANQVQVTGNLGNSGSEISVNVYEDLLYGGLMFQDVGEPQPPVQP